MSRELIIAIDGPSGAGKSTLSKLLAKHLGYLNIDTGAMYRSVALAAMRAGIDPGDERALEVLCGNLRVEFSRGAEGDKVLLNGEDVSGLIRTPEVSLLTSRVSACASVRMAMVRCQREMGRAGGVVLEGRDIGTVVFPQAEVKFFLVATAEERGRRRFEELRAKGLDVDLQQTIAEVIARDEADSSRAHAPLVQATDALAVDSTGIGIEQVLTRMLDVVADRRKSDGLGERP